MCIRTLSLLIISLSALFSGPVLALPFFINEFHYDNVGSDSGEAVEIMGLSGTDLSGWSLNFYNGLNGQSYASWELSGVISNQQDGFGVLEFYGRNTIQNGASDGIALVDSFGVVQQFLSYEGVLTATNGPASGLASIDIGIEESSSTPVGYSLQLTGVGSSYSDFIWQASKASFGVINEGQLVANVATYSVSEPPAWALLLVSVGFLRRRKKQILG